MKCEYKYCRETAVKRVAGQHWTGTYYQADLCEKHSAYNNLHNQLIKYAGLSNLERTNHGPTNT